MKRLLLSMIFAFVACIASFAQINDGQLPGSRFRVLLPITTSYEGTHGTNHNVTAQPLFIYKVPVTKWFAVAGAASYNINNEAFSPKVWLAFSTKRLYILQRNNYDCKTKYYNGGTAMTYKITDNVGIDYTWDNMYASKRWFDYDRLQFVATWRPNSKFNFNAGYSCRHQKGFVANMRYNIKDGIRLQGKVDCGAKNVTAQFIWDFN